MGVDLLTAIKGAMEQSNGPNNHSFRKAVIGVIVADVQHTTKSEQLREKMNMFGTVCRLLQRKHSSNNGVPRRH